MNVTELARRLKISTKELRELLPKLGFKVGAKAIKIEEKLANEIISNWRRLMYDYKKKLEYDKNKALKSRKDFVVEEKKDIFLPKIITVREFAALLNLPVTSVIAELMKNGIMASLNERLDFETAAIVAGDLGYNVQQKDEDKEDIQEQSARLEKILEENKDGATTRPPVVVIMGHVDHGKTKLLDTIRTTNIVAGESGGITQHIGAYQVVKKDRVITFIDTPGHEAFTAMRSRGAKVADIAILIVAADDGVKPQTVEAMRIIQNSELPMIVAINKIDKEQANLEKTKTELSQYNLIPEEWGGKTPMVPISALKGDGIDEILDMILLTADVNEDVITADCDAQAAGTIIESHVDKGEGIVATVLIQSGTLTAGDTVTVNGEYYGKIRVMKDHIGNTLEQALPSVPAKIIGLKVQPKVGDLLEVPLEDKNVKRKVKKYRLDTHKESSILLRKSEEEAEQGKKALPIVLKADTLGSLEAIIESLEKIHSDHIKVQVISKGLGNLAENDIKLAQTSDAMLIGFHVNVTPTIQQMANECEVEVKMYEIIYNLIDDVKDEMERRLGDEVVREDMGQLEVLGIFKTDKDSMILGGKVKSDEITFEPKNGLVKITVTRKGEYVTEGILDQLQMGKESVKIVEPGNECGIRFVGRPEILIGDVLEFHTEKKQKRVL